MRLDDIGANLVCDAECYSKLIFKKLGPPKARTREVFRRGGKAMHGLLQDP